MYKHHQETIERVIQHFSPMEEVKAILLVGSIAHGFSRATSDVDIMVIVSPEVYESKKSQASLNIYEPDLSTYESGYVDGKYVTLEFMDLVSKQGSEPARYAFKDAVVLYSEIKDLESILKDTAVYDMDSKSEKLKKFYAQFQAWHWYVEEALKSGNDYLLHTALSKFILFGGRLILAHNECLFPYHKWFLKVLDTLDNKPDQIMTLIDGLLEKKDAAAVKAFYDAVCAFENWPGDDNWPHQFMCDSELTWMVQLPSVEDL